MHPEDDSVYFCGNSLGLMARRTRDLVNQELDVWASSYISVFIYCIINFNLLF